VARRFELERRRDNLSFAHHAEVAPLTQPEQDYWLRVAEEKGWSRNQLRREVRASLAERQRRDRPPAELHGDRADAADQLPRQPMSIQVLLEPEQVERCEQ